MPYRCYIATRIQTIWRGYQVRTSRELHVLRFPYRLPAYRNQNIRYRSREEYEDDHCGLDIMPDDCIDNNIRHSLVAFQVPRDIPDYFCDWCMKDIDYRAHTQYWTCSRASCEFHICEDCIDYAQTHMETCDLWRVCEW